MSDIRVRCHTCEAVQTPAESCRRCGRPLPKPIIQTVEVVRTVEKIVPVIDLSQSLAEIERIVIVERVRRLGSILAAARSLGLSRNTMYRKVRLYTDAQNGHPENQT